MKQRVFVVGVGLTKFQKAGTGKPFNEISREAITMALRDTKLSFHHIKAAVASYNYGEPASGQHAVYEAGLTGIPVINVNNNCSAGSTALMVAKSLILTEYDCVLAVGFETMKQGLAQLYTAAGWKNPYQRHFDYMFYCGSSKKPLTDGKNRELTDNIIKMFADAATEHQKKFGTKNDDFAKIAWKNHKHAVHNPYAMNQNEYTLQQVNNPQRSLYGPLTLYQASPVSDGAACAILCNEDFLKKHKLEEQAVEIVAQAMVTDLPSSFDQNNPSWINLCGYEMNKKCFEKVYHMSGLTPNDVQVLEVHDCFSSNELMICEAAGLCPQGQGGKMVNEGTWITNNAGGQLYQYSGRWVVNPSGGLESKGHPTGATGISQCVELYWQLCGKAGKRQVDGAKVGLQHNFGLGSATVVTMYKRYTPYSKL